MSLSFLRRSLFLLEYIRESPRTGWLENKSLASSEKV